MQLGQTHYRHQFKTIFIRCQADFLQTFTRWTPIFWSEQLRPLLSVQTQPTLEVVFIHSFGKDAGPLLCKVEGFIYSGPFQTPTCSIWSWKTFTALDSHNFRSGYRREILSVALSPQQKPNVRSQYCKQFIRTKWKVCNSVSGRTCGSGGWKWGWGDGLRGGRSMSLVHILVEGCQWVGRRQEKGTWVYSCLRRVFLRRGGGGGGSTVRMTELVFKPT